MLEYYNADDETFSRKLRKQINMTDVSIQIEELKRDMNIETYRAACIEYLELIPENLDFPDLVKLISPTLKDKIRQEAVRDGFFRGETTGDLELFY